VLKGRRLLAILEGGRTITEREKQLDEKTHVLEGKEKKMSFTGTRPYQTWLRMKRQKTNTKRGVGGSRKKP